jgi:hypothetical protein
MARPPVHLNRPQRTEFRNRRRNLWTCAERPIASRRIPRQHDDLGPRSERLSTPNQLLCVRDGCVSTPPSAPPSASTADSLPRSLDATDPHPSLSSTDTRRRSRPSTPSRVSSRFASDSGNYLVRPARWGSTLVGPRSRNFDRRSSPLMGRAATDSRSTCLACFKITFGTHAGVMSIS